jgi:Family of unknown function (DUF6510)
MDELVLDGNAAAGVLQQVFAAEVTTAQGTCAGCGNVDALGAVVVYSSGPGMVLRCRRCESVLAKIATDGERIWLDIRGVAGLELQPWQ